MGIGAAAGWVAAQWVGGKEARQPGWHARKGGAAARTMALTTAAAAGVPAAAGALMARPPPAQAGAQLCARPRRCCGDCNTQTEGHAACV